MKSLCLAVLALAGGCDLYFGGGDDDCVPFPEVSDAERRDPFTGACVAPELPPCDEFAGPVEPAEPPAELSIAAPDWAFCFNACGGHDEATCTADPQCRVIYDANSNVDEPPRFRECWGIAPSGPAAPGGCADLDAYECSRHNDCVAMYDDAGDGSLAFTRCVPEAPTCFADTDCIPDQVCTTSLGECLPPPGCDGDQACPAVCAGRCASTAARCEAIDCAPGFTCDYDCRLTGTGDVICQPLCVPEPS